MKIEKNIEQKNILCFYCQSINIIRNNDCKFCAHCGKLLLRKEFLKKFLREIVIEIINDDLREDGSPRQILK